MSKSGIETQFAFQVMAYGLPKPEREFRFCPGRRFALDFAWPEYKIAVECEGGIWRQGGGAHSHPLNILRDIEKHNLYTRLGWAVYRFTGDDVSRGKAVKWLDEVFKERKGQDKVALYGT